eukprot:TRINITY_DN19645_c0_g1_i1.p1 TRINITY_DN19645_c0_g1~~TRINITY_DN19645_c0_g1_i1.p1  ORF type:complete len:533 (+),score=89.68 TRINITY_DN19645_c0_g1_i1:55-1653(+)
MLQLAASSAARELIASPTEVLHTSPPPGDDEDDPAQQSHGRCFPMTCCAVVPCLPNTMTRIQDWLHLVLVMAVFVTFAAGVRIILGLALHVPQCTLAACLDEILAFILCLCPSTAYFLTVIHTYDAVLKDKKERFQGEVESLIDNINQHVAEMNDLCRKVTDNANHFAMGRFNDKCDQFLRFLKSVKVHYREFYVDAAMLDQFKAFTISWLRNFAGRLLNPEGSPLLKGASQEIIACHSPQAVCDVAMRRISESQAAFKFQIPVETPEAHPLGDVERGEGSDAEGEVEGKCGISWISCGRTTCGRVTSQSIDKLPATYSFCCCSLVVLSKSHASLIFCVFLDLVFLGGGIFIKPNPIMIATVFLNLAAVITVLACFEQIDELAKLEHQILQFEKRNEEVKEERQEAMANWEKVERLHDLWLYRTLPVLGIMGKVHAHLEDEDMLRSEKLADGEDVQDTRPVFLRLANVTLDCLEQNLGALDSWMSQNSGDEWKQGVGKEMQEIENVNNIHDLLRQLPNISDHLDKQAELKDQ